MLLEKQNSANRSDGRKPPHFESRMFNRSQASLSTARLASSRLEKASSNMTAAPVNSRNRRNCSTRLSRSGSSYQSIADVRSCSAMLTASSIDQAMLDEAFSSLDDA